MRRMLIAAALALGATAAMAQTGHTIRIGLQDDIGSLDPARSVQLVDRIVFASLCNALVDITPDQKIVPMLATSWTTSADGKTLTFKLRKGVKFQNDEPFNAAAVKANLDRDRTLQTSNRKSELASVDHVDVIDDYTVAIVLKQPDAALLATLTDRAGMMLAPKTLADPAGVAAHPVCSGPYKFVQRVQNDRVVLEKFGVPVAGEFLEHDAWSSCRFRTAPCASPICARVRSTCSSASRPPMSRRRRATRT